MSLWPESSSIHIWQTNWILHDLSAGIFFLLLLKLKDCIFYQNSGLCLSWKPIKSFWFIVKCQGTAAVHPIKNVLPRQWTTCPNLCLDLCAWQHSTGEIETSDLAFNGGEGGAVLLKQHPLQCHSFVNMVGINNVAASLKASYSDGYQVRQRHPWVE